MERIRCPACAGGPTVSVRRDEPVVQRLRLRRVGAAIIKSDKANCGDGKRAIEDRLVNLSHINIFVSIPFAITPDTGTIVSIEKTVCCLR